MRKTMTDEHKAKMKAANDAQRARFAEQFIPICEGWDIRRIDEDNWGLVKDNDLRDGVHYFGKLLHALEALPHKLLNEGQKRTLEDILRQQREIAEIMASKMFTLPEIYENHVSTIN